MNVLAATVAGILYPQGAAGNATCAGTLLNGLPLGGMQASITGQVVSIYPGWPSPQQLDKDLPKGIAHVNVYPWKQDRNTTRYMERWQAQRAPVPTITATINDNAITLGGVMGPGQNIAVIVNGAAFVYQTVATDTLGRAAAALAANINETITGTMSMGACIVLPPGTRIAAARVGAGGTAVKEVGRQERIFHIGIWSGSPQLRDSVAKAVQPQIRRKRFLVMPDGFGARIIYHGDLLNDSEQKQGIYRRDLLWSIDYATTITEEQTQVIAPRTNIGMELYGAELPGAQMYA
jgi:hypothetical protein